MRPKPTKVELLAPAGNFEKLRVAVDYGADAVYLADRRFSLRNAADNFSVEQIARAVAYAGENNVRLYVACNIYPRTNEEYLIADYLQELAQIKPDAVIVADPGIVMMAREMAPQIPIHLSTQANTTSLEAVRFWEQQGVSRVNLARELTLTEIAQIASQTSVQIETFVHGSMCMAYSGRCLLSGFLTGRESNRGLCSQPCRWQYSLAEETRPGVWMPVFEDDRGSYVFNAKDLCMIEHMDRLIEAGVSALKIEGRMKSIHYLAATLKVYREAIDAYYENPEKYRVQTAWIEELEAVNNRGFSTGFYFGPPESGGIKRTGARPGTAYRFLAKILQARPSGRVTAEIKNKLCQGDTVEILTAGGPVQPATVLDIFDAAGSPMEAAMPNSTATLVLSATCGPNDLVRRRETPYAAQRVKT